MGLQPYKMWSLIYYSFSGHKTQNIKPQIFLMGWHDAIKKKKNFICYIPENPIAVHFSSYVLHKYVVLRWFKKQSFALNCSFIDWHYSVFQGDYDPVKTRVLHFRMNPSSVAKQQRQQEVETLREEVTTLRELVRSLQEGGGILHAQDSSGIYTPNISLSLPPSKEVQGKMPQTWWQTLS